MSPEYAESSQRLRNEAAGIADARKARDAARKPLRILVTEGSSTSARQALYSLQKGDVVDVLDPNPLCQCRFSRLIRSWRRCPNYARDPLGYLRFLVERLLSEDYDVLLPTHEQVYLLSRVREPLSRLVGLALPEFAALDRMQDKANFIRLLDELDLPHPPTMIVSGRDDLEHLAEFPCYIKTAHGTAGLGVHRVSHAEDLGRLADELERAGEFDGEAEFLIQQPAVGGLSVAFGVFQHGRMAAHHMTRVRKDGLGAMARESVNHPRVVDDMQRIARRLNWRGAFFLDYFYDEATGRRQYLEANPRIGETVNARLCGVNLCEQLIRISLGEEAPPMPMGKTGVRSHQGYLLGLAAAMDGKSRWRILREVMRARRQRGFYENSEDELARPGEDWLSPLPAGAVVAQLVLRPQSARRIVRRAVDDYGLNGPAAKTIRELSEEQLAGCFRPLDG